MMMPTGPPSEEPPTGGSIEDIVNDINGGKKKKNLIKEHYIRFVKFDYKVFIVLK